ncbi:hypothetical protein SAMN05421787_108168 [Virgibacillus pantothenticus]|nr:hypothetical protein SAMN05421787_108168 [Virgibacillus pantothenticus]
MYLGTSNGRPLFTFTNPNPMKEEAIHTPARPYLRTIAKGLLQLGLSKEQTVAYLLPKKGINGNFSISSLYTCLFGK